MWIAKGQRDTHENPPLNDTPMRNRRRTSGDSSSSIIAPRVSTWMVFAVGNDGPATAMICVSVCVRSGALGVLRRRASSPFSGCGVIVRART